MRQRTRPTLAGLVAALAVAVGAVPAAAGPAPAAPAGWVIENHTPDGSTYGFASGSATVVDAASGATISCQASGGWGTAGSGTVPEESTIGTNWASTYDSCVGPGAEGMQVESVYIWYGPTSYDAAADRVTGWALADIWVTGLTWPGCTADLYNVEPNAFVPMTYDNPSGTLTFGAITASVEATQGDACAGRPQVGDVVTFETSLVVAPPGFTVRPA